MNKNPLVSIITATYNAEDFIQSSIESVINQTYRNFEYIIIDGGSTDNTVQILKDNNNNISFWQSEADSGIYNAWNKGIKESKGNWILFIGADDILLPNALETYINYINQNPNIDFDYISSKVKRINLDGSMESIVGKPWVWSSFKKRMTTAHPGSFHSRGFFIRYGLYNEKYKIVSDYEILLRAKDKLKAGFIDEITILMSTGTRLKKSVAVTEILDVLQSSSHLNNLEFFYIKLRTYIGYYSKVIIKKILQ